MTTSLADRQFDSAWFIPACLAVFALVWTAILVVAYINVDLHPDVIETWTLGQNFQWGGSKHPPLMGWVAGLWTLVFPVTDWSFQLLAMTNSAIALWMIDVVARQFTDDVRKRFVIILLLLLTPIYQFQAQKFNANSVLFATWPLAVYCFLRSFETLQSRWAIAAGVAAALTMLGKYYSIFLLIGFLLASVVHQDRRRYFTSTAPWISMLAGGLVLSPHIYALATSSFSSFRYAYAVHGGVTAWDAFSSGLSFLLGVAATLALPAIVWAVMIRTRISDYWRDWRSLDSRLKFLLLIGVGTIISPPIVSLFSKSVIVPLWASQGLFIFVVVAVCAARFSIDRIEIVRLAGAICIFTIALLLIAPVHAYYRNTNPFPEGRNYFSLATKELMARWTALTPARLKIVSGERLAAAISFYSPDHPVYVVPSTPGGAGWQVPPAETLAKGWATMCFDDDAACQDWSKQVLAAAPRAISFSFVVQPEFLGRPGTPAKIDAIVLPPAGVR